jgi:hypothetical protein
MKAWPTPMYERFYNLRERPFYRSRDSQSASLNRVHRETVDTDTYINSRLERAAIGEPLQFPPDVTELVHALSGGIPRVIDVICDAALLVGYAEERQIDCALVQDVMQELAAAGVLHQKPPALRDLSHAAQSPSRVELELVTKAGAPALIAAVDPGRPPSPPIPVAKPDRRAGERELAQATQVLNARDAELLRQRAELVRRENALSANEAALARRERQIAEQRRIMNEEYRLLRRADTTPASVNQRGLDEPDCGHTAESHPAP